MTLALAILLAVQQPEVTATVDRSDALVGETIVLTIVVRTSGDEPVEIGNPDLVGFEFVDVREQSRVALRAGVPERETRRDVTLRAVTPGTGVIGAVVVRHGGRSAATSPIRLPITRPDAAAGSLAPHVRVFLERATPPALGPEQVGLAVYPSPGVVVLGEQVDLVVVAWFPREIRSRLRAPPTLVPPTVRGAWSYRRATPTRPALSRQVRGIWYDLYVLHDVVFPVTAGAVEIGRAAVSYAVPLTVSVLSREVRHEVQSEPLTVAVRSQPVTGRPAGFRGAAGAGITFRVAASDRELPLGRAATVTATFAGRGNLALWPEPLFAWPPGLRVYPEGVDETVTSEDGYIGGAKMFRYLVVAESLGTHRVLPSAYRYFDVATGRYVALEAGPLEFVTAGPTLAGGREVARPPLIEATPAAVDRLSAQLPLWAIVFLIFGAPLVAVLLRLLARRARRRTVAAGPRRPGGDALDELGRALRESFAMLVPDPARRDGPGLADALRAAGVPDAVAAHAARVRDRLRLAMYGPEGASDPDELAAEARAVLEALGRDARPGRWRPAGALVTVAVVAGLGAAPAGWAQTPERLYETGAVRAAADSFARRAAAHPRLAAHWHNLAAARVRLGDGAGARAAWVRGARLAPRDPAIRRGLGLVPAPDRASARLTWISPVTPAEAGAAALVLWWIGWLVLGVRRRRVGVVGIVLALVAAGYAGYVAERYRRPVALAATAGTPLREAPYGPAPASALLEAGAAVLLESARGPWWLVRHGERQGWVLTAEVERL